MSKKQLTFLLEEPPVSPSQSLESEKDWARSVVHWPYNICDLPGHLGLDGLFGRTCQVYSRQTVDAILQCSKSKFLNAGMGSPIEYLTLKTSEYPNDGEESSLSAILETGDLPQQYYLSPKACQGILDRAERRGKTLPPQIERPLREVASRLQDSTNSETIG